MLAQPESNPPRGRPPYGIYAYTAREWDPEINLYYYRARYYDPKVGRFLSEDPLKLIAGVNFYAYVDNNPISRVDPFGLQSWNPKKWWDVWNAWKRAKRQKKCIDVSIECDRRVQCKCDSGNYANAAERLNKCQEPGGTCCAKIVFLCQAGLSFNLDDCAPPLPPEPSPTPTPTPNPCSVYGQTSKQCRDWWEGWKKKHGGEW